MVRRFPASGVAAFRLSAIWLVPVLFALAARPVSASISAFSHAFVAFSGGNACVSGGGLHTIPPSGEDLFTGGHCDLLLLQQHYGQRDRDCGVSRVLLSQKRAGWRTTEFHPR
jgi:hypothetical protein